MQINCQFSEPINLGTEEWPDWAFSKIECEPTEKIFELITNPEYPEREFFVQKSFSYGDFLLIFVFVIILIFGIAGKILNYFWKK